MKIRIEAPPFSVGLREIKQGDLFRYANGKKQDTVMIALEFKTEGYDTFWICRNFTTNTLHKLYWTNKGRKVVVVEPVELVVHDRLGGTAPGFQTILEDPEGPPDPKAAPE